MYSHHGRKNVEVEISIPKQRGQDPGVKILIPSIVQKQSY